MSTKKHEIHYNVGGLSVSELTEIIDGVQTLQARARKLVELVLEKRIDENNKLIDAGLDQEAEFSHSQEQLNANQIVQNEETGEHSTSEADNNPTDPLTKVVDTTRAGLLDERPIQPKKPDSTQTKTDKESPVLPKNVDPSNSNYLQMVGQGSSLENDSDDSKDLKKGQQLDEQQLAEVEAFNRELQTWSSQVFGKLRQAQTRTEQMKNTSESQDNPTDLHNAFNNLREEMNALLESIKDIPGVNTDILAELLAFNLEIKKQTSHNTPEKGVGNGPRLLNRKREKRRPSLFQKIINRSPNRSDSTGPGRRDESEIRQRELP